MTLVRQRAEAGRTQEERRREAEARIVRAAFDIVARRGVDQLTLAEAGEQAGYSRALPAHYFDNREVLLKAVAEHAIAAYHRRLNADGLDEVGIESLLAAIAFYMNGSRRWPTRLRAFYEVMHAALRWPSMVPAVARLDRESVERYARHIRAGQERGDIRPELDPVAEARIIVGALRGMMTQWLVAPREIDLTGVRDSYLAGLRRSLIPDRHARSQRSSR